MRWATQPASRSPRQTHDLEGADALLPGLAAQALIAGRTFDAEARVLEPLSRAEGKAVIPPKSLPEN